MRQYNPKIYQQQGLDEGKYVRHTVRAEEYGSSTWKLKSRMKLMFIPATTHSRKHALEH